MGCLYGTKFNAYELLTGWFYDSRNRALFANRGKRHSVTLSLTAPGSEVEYYVFSYEGLQLIPLGKKWTVALGAALTDTVTLVDTPRLPKLSVTSAVSV